MSSRFAPSPTGYLHLGGARTALYAWLWAKQNNKNFILRIEDTDRERSTDESIKAILDGMTWLGLDYDEGPYYQTKRYDRYNEVVDKLISSNHAYFCNCSQERIDKVRDEQRKKGLVPRYDGHCRDKNLTEGVVRFKNPIKGSVSFYDEIKGDISIDNTQLDDLIIKRSDGNPTYNLTVVVDDHDMQIETVIRGDDHINNTPKQINLYKALNWTIPKFAHLPMILGSDGSRLSKRHGAVSVIAYKEKGYLPEAFLNYLLRLGWSHGDQEIFSINEMIKLFDLKNVNNSPAAFDEEKLLWLNHEYIKKYSNEDLLLRLDELIKEANIDIRSGPNISDVLDYLKDRSKTLIETIEGMKIFYEDFDSFDTEKANKFFSEESLSLLSDLMSLLEGIDEWTKEKIHFCIEQICQKNSIGFGKIGQPFRLALTGHGNAGSIDSLAELIGKEKSLNRLVKAIQYQK